MKSGLIHVVHDCAIVGRVLVRKKYTGLDMRRQIVEGMKRVATMDEETCNEGSKDSLPLTDDQPPFKRTLTNGLQIFATNFFGVVNGLNAFVPAFQSRSSSAPSAIIITGSKQGITNPPGNAAYNASKSAVKTLAEHLSYDLRDTKTSVHLLVPGWTFTGLVSENLARVMLYSVGVLSVVCFLGYIHIKAFAPPRAGVDVTACSIPPLGWFQRSDGRVHTFNCPRASISPTSHVVIVLHQHFPCPLIIDSISIFDSNLNPHKPAYPLSTFSSSLYYPSICSTPAPTCISISPDPVNYTNPTP